MAWACLNTVAWCNWVRPLSSLIMTFIPVLVIIKIPRDFRAQLHNTGLCRKSFLSWNQPFLPKAIWWSSKQYFEVSAEVLDIRAQPSTFKSFSNHGVQASSCSNSLRWFWKFNGHLSLVHEPSSACSCLSFFLNTISLFSRQRYWLPVLMHRRHGKSSTLSTRIFQAERDRNAKCYLSIAFQPYLGSFVPVFHFISRNMRRMCSLSN